VIQWRPTRDRPKLWIPKRVLVTPAALEWEHGRRIAERAATYGCDIVELKTNRLTGLRNDDPRREYIGAKSTLAVVVAPPSKLRCNQSPRARIGGSTWRRVARRTVSTATWRDR
jgi:spore photoproduct lyase